MLPMRCSLGKGERRINLSAAAERARKLFSAFTLLKTVRVKISELYSTGL